LRDWNLSMSPVHEGKKHMLYLPFPNGRDVPFSLSNMKTTTWIIHYDFKCDCEVYRCPYMDGLKIVELHQLFTKGLQPLCNHVYSQKMNFKNGTIATT
jgi:hypothetical protein